MPMKNDIARFLKQDSAADVFFTTMIDLYALHTGFPGRDEADKLKDDPYRREAIGPQVGELIGLAAIRAKCPHFGGWLTRLEQLGSARTS